MIEELRICQFCHSHAHLTFHQPLAVNFLFFSANTSDCAQQHEDEGKSDIFCSWVIEYSTVRVCICRSSQLGFPRKYFQMKKWASDTDG